MLPGIKQGLLLSLFQFIVYINDIFDFFYGLHSDAQNANENLHKIHILIHDADISARYDLIL